MSTLTDLQARITAIKLSRDTGALVVRHGDEMVTFRSLAEMNKIIGILEGEEATLQGTTRRKPSYIYETGKGL